MKRFLPFLLSVCILASAGAPVLAAEDDYSAIPATADSYIINSILSGLGLQLFSSGMSVSELDAAIGELWALFRSDVSAGAWEPDPSWNTSGVNFFSVYSDLKAAIHTPNYVGLAAPIQGDAALVAALYVTVHPVIYNSVLAFRDWYKWKYMSESDVVSVIAPVLAGGLVATSASGLSFTFPLVSEYLGADVSVVGPSLGFELGETYYLSDGSAITFNSGYSSYTSNAIFLTFSHSGYSSSVLLNGSDIDNGRIQPVYLPGYGISFLTKRINSTNYSTWVPAKFDFPSRSFDYGWVANSSYISRTLPTQGFTTFNYSDFPAYWPSVKELFYLKPSVLDLPISGSSSASLDIWDDSDPVGTPIDEPADVPVIIGLGDLVGSLGDLLSGSRDFVVHSIEVGSEGVSNIRDALQGYIDKVGAATDDLAVSVPGASSISLQGTIVKAEDVPAEIPTDTPSGFTPIIPIPDLNLSNLGTAFRSIWHYIEEWLATFRSGITWVFNLFSYLPYALVVPLYAGIAFMLIFYILKKVGF